VLRRGSRCVGPLLALLAAGCGGGDTVEGPAPIAPVQIRLSSPGFAAGAMIPRRYTCDGDDTSPPLVWTKPPKAARELALLMEDPDAPNGTFVHWTVYGIAPRTVLIDVNEPPADAEEGENSFGKRGYSGPCPPEGDKPHRYVFTIYALRSALKLAPGAKPADVRSAIAERAIARGQLVGRFKRG
jgi:Raf kinase inhibitor-like YbhB/YbcL family protein